MSTAVWAELGSQPSSPLRNKFRVRVSGTEYCLIVGFTVSMRFGHTVD